MPIHFNPREQLSLARYLAKWLALAIPLGIAVGSACAFFLWSLDAATATRLGHPALVWLLPLAGIAIGGVYQAFGKSVEAGNNLIVDEIHEPGGGVPLRMAPLILVSTVFTHLFGGSAGREGTAVQMGGSLASGFARLFPRLFNPADVRTFLMAGISAGFGGVFGTPVAGTIFALEVLAIGRMNYAALIPSLIAGIASDQTCTAWGIHHTHYHVNSLLEAGSPLHLAPLTLSLLSKMVLASALFGLASVLFAESVHGLHHVFKSTIRWPILRPAIGGLIIIAMMYTFGTRDYLGLGVTAAPGHVSILSSFHPGGAHTWSWLWKLLFTVVTLSSGFKGGEVTPLFFIGAALGNTLALLLGAPVDLFAALGFISVFAGATNTPLACTMMGIELFGGEYAVHFAIATFTAYLFSGHSGIYLSQRIGTPKIDHPHVPTAETLRAARNAKPHLLQSKKPTTTVAPTDRDQGRP